MTLSLRYRIALYVLILRLYRWSHGLCLDCGHSTFPWRGQKTCPVCSLPWKRAEVSDYRPPFFRKGDRHLRQRIR